MSKYDLWNPREPVVEVEIEKLQSFAGHPFIVREDEDMKELIASIRQHGVMVPIIVRPLPDEKYEIVSGHRRKYAAEKLGLKVLPAVIRRMHREEAIVMMVDSNLQRSFFLPSEKAKAYRMKYQALLDKRHRIGFYAKAAASGKRTIEIMSEEFGDSPKQVQRYIRIATLSEALLEKLDTGKLSVNPAYELSFLRPEEQKWVSEAIDYTLSAPSVSQAQRMKEMSKNGDLTEEETLRILEEVKKGDLEQVTFKLKTLYRYFPSGTSIQDMQSKIINMLENWKSVQKDR